MELHLDAAVLIGEDLVAGRPYHDRRLRAVDERLGGGRAAAKGSASGMARKLLRVAIRFAVRPSGWWASCSTASRVYSPLSEKWFLRLKL